MLRILLKNFHLTLGAALIAIAGACLPQRAAADFIQQGEKLVGVYYGVFLDQGSSVAISDDGNTAIVGDFGNDDAAGAAQIWVRSNGVWAQQGEKLLGSNASGPAQQGWAVALSADGNTALILGDYDNQGVGAVWIFVRNNGVWTQQGDKLVGTGSVGTSSEIGTMSAALSADGNTAILGRTFDNGNAGAAWVFVRNSGVWAQQGSKLVATGAIGQTPRFGRSVAVSGDGNTALVGGSSDNSSKGAAWVFNRNSGTWSQFGGKLVGTGAIGAARQGFAVALSADGKTAAVGGYSDDSNIGATWVFAFDGTAWLQQGSKLVGAGSTEPFKQGRSVSLSRNGDTLLIGGVGDVFNSESFSGAAWVFGRSAGTWSQLGNRLVGSGDASTRYQGRSVALSGDGSTAIIGGIGGNTISAAWVWLRRPPHDFSGDTNSDILWRNISGETGMWLMSGSTLASAAGFGIIPNTWSAVGQRDFNSDGKSDLLWRNSNGDIGIWFMNGGSIASLATIGNVDASWSVVGTGDFDGDRKADILWRNTSGEVGIWFMNGGTVTSLAGLGNPGTNWSVAGTGDFNGDGKADILWRSTSHDIGIWFMNGGTIASTASLGNVGATWSVAGTGDFDGGGKTDILWRSTSNDIGLWLMDGASVTPVGLGNVGAAWNVASVGDYNGNGKADILWRSTSHEIGIWFMNGATLVSTAGLGNVGPNWQVQNAGSN